MKDEITDITGTVLSPGNHGNNCNGNGGYVEKSGNQIECCCDECDYYLECFPEYLQGTDEEDLTKD